METHLRKKYYEISLVSCMKSSALSTRCPRIDSCKPEWHLLRLYWTMHLPPGWEVPDYHGALSHTLFHNLWVNSLRRGIVLVFLGPFRTFLVFWVALRGSTVQVHKHVVLQSTLLKVLFLLIIFLLWHKTEHTKSKNGVRMGNHIPQITEDPGSDNKSKYNPGLPNKP